MLTATEKANEGQANKLNGLMSIKISDEEKVSGVLEIYNELEVPSLTKFAMQNYFDKSLAALNQIEAATDLKQPLIELAEMLMMRKK